MRTDLESRLRDRLTEAGYLFPDYGGYCFASVPGTVRSVLGDDGGQPLPADVLAGLDDEYDRVLVVLVDGFGLAFWKRHRGQALVDRLADRGTVTPLTSVYPSETAAALTTVHTGRLPASHGLLGWDVYDPVDDASYEAFTGTVKAGDESVAHDLQDVFEGDPIYPSLERVGIDCRHVVPFPETYDGATCHSYGPDESLDGFEPTLQEAFDAADDPAYLFAYLPQIDTAAHGYGTDSDEYRATVDDVFETIDRALAGLDADAAGDTLVVLTADHGHVDTDADRNVDLETIDGVVAALDRHGNGDPVRYAGSPRNVHLHLRDGRVDDVRSILDDRLDARVFTQEDVVDRDLFGGGPRSETFERRLGDLVVVHRDSGVWYGSDQSKLDLIGMHGGLHPDEMLVPFAAIDLEALLARR
ncbi:alkaline phosphatase family protein [Halosolutus amylolyticus]|uniref:Alkaline phosphatase family protein n=1 Tax=Halosolutus amylolyticus TaxID=2932267 RepID=A0ABD5PV03_9EURY|nr:nucleotide pyrophosphatase/phosphodiesterase family protein [Halosolutus amylolyticus]